MVYQLDKEKEIELLMDIQEKVGRIDERLKRVEGTSYTANEALTIAKKNEIKISELDKEIQDIKKDKKEVRTTAWGAFISAAVALLSVIATHFWG